MNRFTFRVTSWALLLALAACGGEGGEAAPGGGGNVTPTPYTLEQSGPALEVNVALDAPRATTLDVPLTGGTITATGADGSTYTLSIPANALERATRITLTPVTQVTNLPLGESASTGLGVQMEPSGLRFLNPATLTITPAAASAVPLTRQLFVQWEGTGRMLGLAAPDPKSSAIRLSVMHFSGMGVVRSKGLDADIEPVRQRIGGDAERRLQSAAAEALMRERQAQQAGTNAGAAGLSAQLTSLFTQFRQQVVLPRIAAAGSSCAAARLAIVTVIGVERQLQLLGSASNDFNTDLLGLMPVAVEVCMKEEFEICRDEHVITRILPARLGLERMAQLLGQGEGAYAAAERYEKGCLKFELDFFSTAGVRNPDFDADEGVQALRTKLEWGGLASGFRFSTVPLQSMYFDVRAKRNCTAAVNATRVGSSFTVDEFSFDISGENVTDFRVTLAVGLTESHFQARDTCASPPVTSPVPLQLNHGTTWFPVRVATASSPLSAFVISGWTVQRAALMATKAERITYQADGSTSLYLDDRWELRHVPAL